MNEAYETLVDSGSRHTYDLSLQWAERPVPARFQPTVVQSGVFRQEDASVFGRFERAPQGVAFQRHDGFDVLSDEWLDSLDELFFGWAWPW